jgi:hypothetical protein
MGIVKEKFMTREQEFKQKLFALLREYNVEMSVKEDDRGYSEGIAFWAYTQYDKDREIVHDKIDFAVGKWEDGVE